MVCRIRDQRVGIRITGHGIDGKSHMDQDQTFWDHGSKYLNFGIRDQSFKLIVQDHNSSCVPCHNIYSR